MKDALIYGGAGAASFLTKTSLEPLSGFNFGESLLIWCIVLFAAVIGGLFGAGLSEIVDTVTKKIKSRWTQNKYSTS